MIIPFGQRWRRLGVLWGVPALLAGGAPRSLAAADEPFAVHRLEAPGRPLALVAARLAGSGGPARRELWLASIEGEPPGERRSLFRFRPAEGGSLPLHPDPRIEMPAEVIGFDLGDLDPAPGLELLRVSAGELRILGAGGARVLRVLPLEPPLPFPARARGLTRLPCVGDWAGDGRPRALLPDVGGARLVALDDGSVQRLELPVVADYETRETGPPAVDELLVARLAWPTLMQADDDGDGRLDLFALSRFTLSVHRSGPAGLPSAPSRTLALRAFTLAEELRHEATSLRLVARDLDGDGRADLVVHRNAGTLLRSHASTDVHRNRGSGIALHDPPDARLVVENGISTLEVVDVDADGAPELLEARLQFGILQLVRLLTTRRVELELRVWTLARPGLAALTTSWSGAVTLPLDFAQGRVDGLTPTAAGDWNGDGRRDLLYGPMAGELAIQLGTAESAGPGFGPRVATQALPVTGQALVADLDGDGLDDLVLHDPRAAAGGVRLLHNRGRLPGTPAQLRAGP